MGLPSVPRHWQEIGAPEGSSSVRDPEGGCPTAGSQTRRLCPAPPQWPSPLPRRRRRGSFPTTWSRCVSAPAARASPSWMTSFGQAASSLSSLTSPHQRCPLLSDLAEQVSGLRLSFLKGLPPAVATSGLPQMVFLLRVCLGSPAPERRSQR